MGHDRKRPSRLHARKPQNHLPCLHVGQHVRAGPERVLLSHGGPRAAGDRLSPPPRHVRGLQKTSNVGRIAGLRQRFGQVPAHAGGRHFPAFVFRPGAGRPRGGPPGTRRTRYPRTHAGPIHRRPAPSDRRSRPLEPRRQPGQRARRKLPAPLRPQGRRRAGHARRVRAADRRRELFSQRQAPLAPHARQTRLLRLEQASSRHGTLPPSRRKLACHAAHEWIHGHRPRERATRAAVFQNHEARQTIHRRFLHRFGDGVALRRKGRAPMDFHVAAGARRGDARNASRRPARRSRSGGDRHDGHRPRVGFRRRLAPVSPNHPGSPRLALGR